MRVKFRVKVRVRVRVRVGARARARRGSTNRLTQSAAAAADDWLGVGVEVG